MVDPTGHYPEPPPMDMPDGCQSIVPWKPSDGDIGGSSGGSTEDCGNDYVPQGNYEGYDENDWYSLTFNEGGTLNSAGCAIATLENILLSFVITSGNILIDIQEMINFADENGYKKKNDGISQGFMVAFAVLVNALSERVI